MQIYLYAKQKGSNFEEASKAGPYARGGQGGPLDPPQLEIFPFFFACKMTFLGVLTPPPEIILPPPRKIVLKGPL